MINENTARIEKHHMIFKGPAAELPIKMATDILHDLFTKHISCLLTFYLMLSLENPGRGDQNNISTPLITMVFKYKLSESMGGGPPGTSSICKILKKTKH